jgi:hypothetical protein
MEGLKEASRAYIGLTRALGEDKVKLWEEEEKKAMMNRGDDLRIYDVKLTQGLCSVCENCDEQH